MGMFKGAAKPSGGFNWGNAALAFFGGDNVLQMMQRRQEIERARQLAAAQQEAAAGLGLTKEEIAGMDSQDIAAFVRERAYRRMLEPLDGTAGGAKAWPSAAPAGDKAPEPPVWKMPPFAPPPGRLPAGVSLASGSFPTNGGGFQSGASPGASWMQPLATLPQARTHAEAAALGSGAYFFAPDASLRRIA
jgi:hypothetical protein